MPARSTRARRLAACTALVLSAGMLLAAPASADDTAPHRTATERLALPADLRPSLDLPEHADRLGAALKPRADFDDDGSFDLVLRTYEGGLGIMPSSSEGVYGFEIPGIDGTAHKDIIPVGDQTGDGFSDLLTLSPYGALSFRSGMSGAGTGNTEWTGKGWQIYNKVLSPGDLTGDGRSDLLARTPAGELYLYPATGNTSTAPFGARVLVGKGWEWYDQLIGANDVTGDGVADLYARTVSGELYFYAGTGSARTPFTERAQAGRGWHIYNQVIGADDLDGDGRGDLIARAVNGDVFVYTSTGDSGKLSVRVAGGSALNTATLLAGAGGAPDYGRSDLLGLDTTGRLWAYRSLNNGELDRRAAISGNWKGKPFLASSLNENTLVDLMNVSGGELSNHSFGPQDIRRVSSGWGGYDLTIGPGDLTGDGRADLLTRDTKGYLYLHPGNGTGTGLAARIRVGGGWNAYNVIIGAGDFTGDGRADVVTRDPAGVLKMYRGTGDKYRPFLSPFPVGGGWNTYTKLAAPGDLTGDGKADLLGVDRNGSLYLYVSNGRGQFPLPVRIGGGWNTYGVLN
ncbi:FG-GAP-like repeat-containing protein [Streptomyces sp. NBC_00385]|uniref:FG-GAP-like repeat-containing protein n=1 Tax=Streptomyces sp. NBC_00385 TaxID=2975733 RepID=UPI002DDAF389|nr:FG-GAP-like repeat-containing protein [Streptomyces sp. NBC_00385]WRZ06030.1 FG-GAP-like repeat-containing protein [Streptomyces sp. NBC_00385]